MRFFIVFLLSYFSIRAEKSPLPPLTPKERSIAIYNQGKNSVLTAYRFGSRRYSNVIISDSLHMYAVKLYGLPLEIGLEELLLTMLADNSGDSNYFLIMILYNFQNLSSCIIFHSVNSLCPSRRFSLEGEKLGRKIFANFRSYIRQIFVSTDSSCWDNPIVFKTVYNSLQTVQIFWHNKLRPIAKKILTPQEFAKEERLIRERFKFLNTFITIDPKVQLFQEYKMFFIKSSNGNKSRFHYENFAFLTRFFKNKLERSTSIASLEEDLVWLASQPSLLLKHFFYYLNSGFFPNRSQSFPDCSKEKPIMNEYIKMDEYFFSIFGRKGSSRGKANEVIVKHARKILQKVQR